MRCRYCGNAIPESEMICPVCGREYQIVPDYNPLDDVLENQVRGGVTQALNTGTYQPVQRVPRDGIERVGMSRSTGRTNNVRQSTGRTSGARQNTGRTGSARQNTGRTSASRERSRVNQGQTDMEERARRRKIAERKRMIAKKKRQRALIIAASIGVILVAAGFVLYQNSYNGQVKKGYKLLAEMEYDNAILRFQNAIEKKKDRGEAYTGLASVYIAQNDLEKAEQVFLTAIKEQSDNELIYEAVIKFYIETSQNTKIAYLLESCSSDNVLNAMEQYATEVPSFGLDETKTYDDVQALEITSTGKAIYYTTDGSEPTVSSKKYTEPIKLEEGETVVKAISINEKDIPSIVVSKTYTVEFPIALAPSVTPSTGQYDSNQKIEVVIPDNYEAYYTTNGADPVPGESGTKEYTKAVQMPEGSTIFKVVLADQKGRLSDITIRNYELIIED